MFVLFNMIFATLAFIVDMVLASVLGFSFVYILYGLGIILPSLAVLVRRLHDIGKSGLWFFISFIPLIGSIWLLVLMCIEGTPGPNQYGEDPKQVLN